MPKLTPAKLAKLAHRLNEVKAEIKALTEEKAKIDAQLEALDPGIEHEAGDLIVTRTPVHGLDADLIVKKYPASKRPEFYKLVLDTAEFKRHFSERQRKQFEKITYRTNIKEA